jgi:16S rRNA processing protein RimM
VAPGSQRRVCVAKIGAPHGVRGEVKLWPYTADPMAVKDFGPLETEDGTRSFTIEALRPAKEFLVARFKDVSDRNAAETLCHIELYVARERLPEPDDDEFYHADLIGLAVVDTRGAALGTVIAVHNFGAGDIIEMQRNDNRATVMLPFTDVVVPEIDIDGGRIVVDPPAGALDAPRRSQD